MTSHKDKREREIGYGARCIIFGSRDIQLKNQQKKSVRRLDRDHASVLYGLSEFQTIGLRFDDFFKALILKRLKIDCFICSYETKKMTAESLLYKYNTLLIENDILKKEIKKSKKMNFKNQTNAIENETFHAYRTQQKEIQKAKNIH